MRLVAEVSLPALGLHDSLPTAFRSDTFYVCDAENKKLVESDIQNVTDCLETMVNAHYSMKNPRSDALGRRPQGVGAKGQSGLIYRCEAFTLEIVVAPPNTWRSLMDAYIPSDVLSVQQSVINHVEYSIGRTRYRFDDFEAYRAASLSVRDRLIESWNDTNAHYRQLDPKRVHYLSMEFLMGRSLLNSLYNLDLKETYTEALAQLGYDMENLSQKERDAALGNGGLGRLAACFLDSMATLNLPAWGYGLRYQVRLQSTYPISAVLTPRSALSSSTVCSDKR